MSRNNGVKAGRMLGMSVAELLVAMTILAALFLGAYQVLIKTTDSSLNGQRLEEVEHIANTASQWMVNDMRSAGYMLSGGDTAFVAASTNEVCFLGDVNEDGTAERVRYYLGATSELARTKNPRDRYLYRSINGESPGRRVAGGVVGLQLDYIDNRKISLLDRSIEPPVVRSDPMAADLNSNGISDVMDIRLISVSILCESGNIKPKSNNEYFSTTIVTSIAPPNLPILAEGHAGSVEPPEPGGEGNTPASIVLYVEPDTLWADGTSTSDLSAWVRDQNGAGMAGLTVSLSIVSGPGGLGNVTDLGTGQYDATYVSPQTTGTAEITATVSGLSDTAYVQLILPPSAIELTATPARISADGYASSLVKAFVKDRNGGKLSGMSVTMTFSERVGNDALSAVSFSASDTSYVATYTSPTVPGLATILCQSEGLSATVQIQSTYNRLIPVGERVLHVNLADIQEDSQHDLDIFVGRPQANSEIAVYTNSGSDDGELKDFGAVYFDAIDAPVGMAVQMMRDSRVDVVVATGSNSFQKLEEIFNGDPVGSLTSSTIYQRSFGGKATCLATGKLFYQKFVPDNSIDCVVGTDARQFEIWLNDGSGGTNSLFYNGTFPKNGKLLGGIPAAIKTGDAREDALGDIDIFVGAGQILELWYANAGADFGKSAGQQPNYTFTEGSKILSLEVGDVNKDGYLDIVVGEQNGTIQVFKNTGGNKGGVFTRSATFMARGAVYSLKLADLNKDGYLDMVAGTGNMEFEVRFSNHAGSFLAPVIYSTAMSGEVSTIDCGDMGEDGANGDVDIVLGVNPSGGQGFVEVWLNNGSGVFVGPASP